MGAQMADAEPCVCNVHLSILEEFMSQKFQKNDTEGLFLPGCFAKDCEQAETQFNGGHRGS